ncbi:HpcH/HpaI aldolase family protein [Halorarius litoreus]|uniref:HpcH/HpaI aldolase family protein n=1 Tax=Halorarius litoreus TaxID=2962676 RepID=UPI0020CB76B9|nr:aldolase/citrate lyase family protein [Halorarius litoreus]
MDERLRAAFRAREPVVGSWILIGHPTIAEVTAGLGFDFVVLDTEHPSYSLETLDTMIAGVAAADGDARPIVRVPLDERNRITRVLNMGAGGILFPVIETAEQAREAAAATAYPPEGTRTIAPGRGSNYLQNFETYVETANDAIVTIVMIETEQGVENAADIAAVDGVDAILVGHEDLSASLGVFAQWEHERLQSAIDRVIGAAHDNGTAVGRVTPDSEAITATLDRGFDFLITGVDLWQLTQMGQRAKAEFDAAVDR